MAVQRKVGRVALPPLYAFGGKWGTLGSGNGQLNGPRGISVASDGSVFVADYGNNRLQKFGTTGTYLAQRAATGNTGVQVSGDRAYIFSVPNIFRAYSLDLVTLLENKTWSGATYSRLAVDNSYVYSQQQNVDFLLTRRNKVGMSTADDLEEEYPVGPIIWEYVAYDAFHNEILFLDSLEQRIDAFDSSFGLEGIMGLDYTPAGLAVDPGTGRMAVCDRTNNRIILYDKFDGEIIEIIGSAGSGDGQFTTISDPAFNASDGTLYVTDLAANRVQYFALNPRTIVTGLGFQPKGLVTAINTDLTAAVGSLSDTARQAIGWAGKTSSAGSVISFGRILDMPTGQSSPTADIRGHTNLGFPNNNRADVGLDGVTFQADGFTIDWNDGPGYDSDAEIIWMAIGGDADARLFGANPVFSPSDVVGTTKTVNIGDSFVITGGLIFAGLNIQESASYGAFAVKPGGFDGWSQAIWSESAISPTNLASHFADDAAITIMRSGAVVFKAVVHAVAATTLTLRVTQNTLSGGDTIAVHGIAFSGSLVVVGDGQKGATDDTIIETERTARALVMMGDGRIASPGTTADHISLGIGFSDLAGGNHRSSHVFARDNVASSITEQGVEDGSAFAVRTFGYPLSTGAPIVIEAYPSISGLQVGLDWETASAPDSFGSGLRFGYLIITISVTDVTGSTTVTVGGTNVHLAQQANLTGAGTVSTGGTNPHLTQQAKLSGGSTLNTSGPSALLSGAAQLSGATTVSIGPTQQPAFLIEAHNLTGSVTVEVAHNAQPGWLGSATIGTAILEAAASITVGGDIAPLKFDHTDKLTTVPSSIEIDVTQTWPPQDHALTGAALLEVLGNLPFLARDPGPLDGAATVGVTDEASPAVKLGNTIALTGRATIVIDTSTLGLTGSPLPQPKQLTNLDVIGTVNLFRNPSFEGSLNTNSWVAVGGATVTVSQAKAWHGTSSLKVDLANAVNSGVRLESQHGLGLTGRPYALLWQFNALAGSAITGGLQVTTEFFYTDGTSAVDETIAIAPNTSSWLYCPAPAMVSNGAKMINSIAVTISRAAAAAGQSFYLDGVQAEEDRGQGHTYWVTGEFGEPYHRWHGATNASMSIRDAIPREWNAPSLGGKYTIETFLFKADANNAFGEDLSQYVISCSITLDTERDIAWSAEIEMLDLGYAKLEPIIDWVAPYMRVTRPNGDIWEGQLGHFVVMPSPSVEHEWGGEVRLDCRSAEQMLKMQGVRGIMFVRENTPWERALRTFLRACHLGENKNGKEMFNLPDGGHVDRAHRDTTWEKKEDALTIANDMAKKAGWKPLFADKVGWLTTVNRKKRRLRNRDPVRSWVAHLPPGEQLPDAAWLAKSGVTDNEIVGDIEVTPDLGKVDDNKIVVISVNPRRKRIRAVHYIDDEGNPVSPQKRKRIKERKLKMDVGSQADAEALAEAIAEELNSDLETVTFSTVPDPRSNFAHEVIYLNIHNAKSKPIAVGKYKVKTVTWGWTDDEAMMQMTAGFVRDVSMKHGGVDPTGWEFAPGRVWDPVFEG